ncbi:MAG: hypothetical protein IPP79_20560 [Chitinophagaceae bacterium]|nr:hypothetical protein [Chitinophagaceae bacterium]
MNNPSLGVLSKVSEEIQPDTDLTKLDNGTYVFFSPRDLPFDKDVEVTPNHLKSYVKLIDKAQELVCMIFPFNYDSVFQKVYDKKQAFFAISYLKKPLRQNRPRVMRIMM